MSRKQFLAAMYLRLSRDDSDVGDVTDRGRKAGNAGSVKSESNSIGNQRELIRAYIHEQQDIELYDIYVDDGFSGSNFDRPEFKRMIGDIEAGKVNCVIVKDLSRFGRDYIESGRYIQKIFPALSVRFIALTDRYDSFQADVSESGIVLPVKNFIKNMSYSGREFRYFTLFRQICVQQSHFVSFLQGIVCLSVGYVSICCVLSKKGNSPCWCRA